MLQPRHVEVALPAYFKDRTPLSLYTAAGRDSIAMQFNQDGWAGFEFPVPDMVAACVQCCTGAFLDVGANTGIYSLVAARSSPAVDVHAFEPYLPVRKILLKNIGHNRLSGRIQVTEKALCDHPGSEWMYVPLQDHGLVESSCSLNADFKGAHSSKIEVTTTTIDEYVREEDVDHVGLIKIDVESTEHRVIAGGSHVIGTNRPVVILEVLHLADADWLNQFCQDQNYVPFLLHPHGLSRRAKVSFHAEAWNQCFCPKEKLDLIDSVVKIIGLNFMNPL